MLRLASASPRRKELLKQAGFKFRFAPSVFEEVMNSKIDPVRLAIFNATGKVRHTRCKSGVVIGADTLISFNQRIIGKPKNRKQAEEFLVSFSGKTHQVVTGVALRNIGENAEKSFAVTSQVTFKKLSPSDINRYLETQEYVDKAGAYGYQAQGKSLIQKTSGSKTNIIGLPMRETIAALKSFGIVPECD